MKRLFYLIALLLTFTLLSGCVSPNMGHSKPAQAVTGPAPGKALVIFMRPSKLGFKVHATVFDGDKMIGMVPYNTKLPYTAKPGKHMFMVVSEAADFMKAELVAGKTYYVQVVPRMGAWRARFSLAPIHRADLETAKVKQWIKNAKFIDNLPSAYAWGKNNRPSILTKKNTYFSKWQKKANKPFLRPEDGK